jgi:hypothetical protein
VPTVRAGFSRLFGVVCSYVNLPHTALHLVLLSHREKEKEINDEAALVPPLPQGEGVRG